MIGHLQNKISIISDSAKSDIEKENNVPMRHLIYSHKSHPNITRNLHKSEKRIRNTVNKFEHSTRKGLT